jgi:hypothetical protein
LLLITAGSSAQFSFVTPSIIEPAAPSTTTPAEARVNFVGFATFQGTLARFEGQVAAAFVDGDITDLECHGLGGDGTTYRSPPWSTAGAPLRHKKFRAPAAKDRFSDQITT